MLLIGPDEHSLIPVFVALDEFLVCKEKTLEVNSIENIPLVNVANDDVLYFRVVSDVSLLHVIM